MATNTAARLSATPFEQARFARDVIQHEAEALKLLANNLPADLSRAVDLVLECEGSVIVAGIGKAGWIGQKISASFCSTGTRSHFLHPAEAVHGDLGRIGSEDVILILSNSGETSEILRLLPTLAQFETPIISITASVDSTLAKHSHAVLNYGKSTEACSLGLAPSTSTTTMLALGDALALLLSRVRQFRSIDFARYHPGGSLGRKLAKVDDIMRPIERCRVALESETIRDIYVRYRGQERRAGMVMVTDDQGTLTGVFTDSDLARMLEQKQDAYFDSPISALMTRHPKTIGSGSKTTLAVDTLACHNLSELPIIDSRGRAIGLIDVTDLVGLIPSQKTISQ
jgi:arabinose-5-phosphate isomerase